MQAHSPDPHADQPIRTSGPPVGKTGAALILVHGRGGSADEMLYLGRELAGERVSLVAPQAANHTWYPYSFLAPLENNEPWLSSALRAVARTVQKVQAEGAPLGQIVLVGFSQGACLAAEYVARNALRLGALVAFTGGRIGPPGTHFEASGELRDLPIYLSAGDPDPHVPWRRMEETRDGFEGMGARVTLRRWPNRPHTILQQEIDESRELIRQVLSDAS